MNGNSSVGGGIENWANLTLKHVVVRHNEASQGGGIWNALHVTAIKTTIRHNDGAFGGGFNNQGRSTARLIKTVIRNNTRGGISNANELEIIDSVIRDNQHSGSGGGLLNRAINQFIGRTTIVRSVIIGNSADLFGSGIKNDAGASVTLHRTIVAKNTAQSGGGVFNNGDFSATRATIVRNTATASGGDIFNTGLASLTNTSVSNNQPDDCVGPDLLAVRRALAGG